VTKVLSVRGEQLQVLGPVVATIRVLVVNDLDPRQESPDGLLHHEAVLLDVPVAIRVRVVRRVDQNVAAAMHDPASSPRWVQRPAHSVAEHSSPFGPR
jgi:hypothetical protein